MTKERIKVTLSELHGYLDGMAWRILDAAVRHRDRELVKAYLSIEEFIDKAIYGPKEQRT